MNKFIVKNKACIASVLLGTALFIVFKLYCEPAIIREACSVLFRCE